MSQNTDERPRGILTPTDREYLRGETEYDNPQSDAHRRRNIRDRIRDSLEDFTLLLEELDEAERDKIFTGAAGSPHKIERSIDDAFGFLCLAVEDLEPEGRPRPEYRWELPELEGRIYFGVKRAFEQEEIVATDVDVNISAEGYISGQIDLVKQAVAVGSPSTSIHEIIMLMRSGEVDRDRLLDFLQEEVDESE